MSEVLNFNPGPAKLPKTVLEKAIENLLEYPGVGISVMEMSHRSESFGQIIHQTEKDLRDLLKIPDDYKVLFLQGGAHGQFSAIPLNFSGQAGPDYVVTGTWGRSAYKEALRLDPLTRLAYTGEDDNFARVPQQREIDFNSCSSYAYFVSNETVQGVQWHHEPLVPEGVPLICDASSDFLSRPLDVNKYSYLYAGAQKNAGIAGVTLGIVRQDLLGHTPSGVPLMMDLSLMAEKQSLFNTPPCFPIYMTGLILQWLKDEGGLEAVAQRNANKAGLVYGVIDESEGFYQGHADKNSRSMMNITFRLPTLQMNKQFIDESKKEGFIGLAGHRSVGGVRASCYNAQTPEAVNELSRFMQNFKYKNDRR